jgi:membrane fusion protein, multidrug efflux system
MRPGGGVDVEFEEAAAAPDGQHSSQELQPPPAPRRRRRWIAGAVALTVGASGVATAWVLANRTAESGGAAEPPPSSTATVERRDLVERHEVDGTLAYSDPRALSTQATGTVTRLAEEGSVVRRGEVLYRVDALPVVLMYGSVPAYRPMATGVEGLDVWQLERNLASLGFDPGEIDGTFGADTAEAVRDWQEDLGLEPTGVVDPGRVVFLPGARRMGSHQVEVGGAAGPGVVVATTTSRTRVVTVDLEARRQDLVHEGDEVTVTLPDGRVLTGHVSSVGRVAETSPDNPDAEPTIQVTIRLDPGGKVGALDQAPVDVGLAIDQAEGVLAVPVSALLALAEGGYAVEVVAADGTTHLVAVDLGVFANGYVEVSGQGLDEGTAVVVPA